MTIKNIQKGFGLLGAALILSWTGFVLAAGP